MPFASTPEGDVYLLSPDHGTTADLDDLVRLGVLSSYRYVDATTPAILAVAGR